MTKPLYRLYALTALAVLLLIPKNKEIIDSVIDYWVHPYAACLMPVRMDEWQCLEWEEAAGRFLLPALSFLFLGLACLWARRQEHMGVGARPLRLVLWGALSGVWLLHAATWILFLRFS